MGLLSDEHDAGATVHEQPVLGSVAELPDWANTLAADEIFLTGTTKDVMPIRQVDETVVGTGEPGPVTRQLLALFDKREYEPSFMEVVILQASLDYSIMDVTSRFCLVWCGFTT